MNNLNDIDVGLPLPGATMADMASEIRNLKAVLKTVLLHSHKPNGAINGSLVSGLGSDIVGSAQILDGSMTTAKIADLAVTNAKLANGAVTSGKLADGLLVPAHFGTACIPGTAFQLASIPLNALGATVTGPYIAAGAIGAAHIVNGAVTDEKITSVGLDKLLQGTATDGQYLKYTTGSGWGPTAGPTIPTIALATFGQESGSDGGNAPTANTWYKRTISEQIDASNIMSIASNEISLEAGDYFMFVRCPAHEVKRHQIRLVRKTVATGVTSTIAVGSGAFAFTGTTNHAQTDSVLFHAFNNPDESTYTYYIEHFFQVVAELDDFGEAVSASSGENCMHTSGFIFKLPG